MFRLGQKGFFFQNRIDRGSEGFHGQCILAFYAVPLEMTQFWWNIYSFVGRKEHSIFAKKQLSDTSSLWKCCRSFQESLLLAEH